MPGIALAAALASGATARAVEVQGPAPVAVASVGDLLQRMFDPEVRDRPAADASLEADPYLRMADAETPLAGAIVDQPALFTPDDLLLLEVDVDGQILSDGLGAYSSRAGVFVPLGELARLLDLAVVVDPSKKRAEGWVGSPDNVLRLDLKTGRAQAQGREFATTRTDSTFYDDEIYVRVDLLQKILPLGVKVDTSGLTMTLQPKVRLPFQERRERELRGERLTNGQGGAAEPTLQVKTPYEAFTWPSLEATLDGALGSNSPKRSTRYEVRAAGDVAWTGVQVFAGSDDDGELDHARILAERKDPDGKLAGPFGATRSTLGDTFTPTLSFGSSSVGGRGFSMTSAPLDQASIFERIDIRGELPLGYQAELYVNEVLRASQSQPIQGRYEFRQINLGYGLNIVRVVLYGPRGERRQEVRRINLGGTALRRGQFVYNFGAVQEYRSVFGLDATDEPTLATPGVGRWRYTGSLAYGVTSAVTVSAGFSQYTPRIDDTRQVGTVGVVTSLAGMSLQVDAARDNRDGTAAGVGIAGRPFGVSVVARHSEYAGGFIDEVQPAAQDLNTELERSSNLLVDFTVPIGRVDLPMSARAVRDEFADGRVRLQGGFRASQAVDGYLVSTSLEYQSARGGGLSPEERLLGGLEISGLVRSSWQVRAGLTYPILPDLRLQSAFLTADHGLNDRSALHLGVNHSFMGDETTFQVGQTWRLSTMDLSLNGSYAVPTNEYRVGLQLSFGLTPDPYARRYRPLGPGAASGGAVAVRAFVDGNGDGRWEDNERVLPGVTIRGGRREIATNAKGVAVMPGLGEGASAQVLVDLETLDDPYLAPPPRVISIVPRPGRVAKADYALAPTGELELNMQVRREGQTPRGVSALKVQLVDTAGKVAAEGRTEFDGTLIFEGLRPGRYVVRLDPEQAERLRMSFAAPLQAVVPPGGGFAGRVKGLVEIATTPRASE